MKIEVSPLDRHTLLSFLKDEAQPKLTVDHFALDALKRLILALEKAR